MMSDTVEDDLTQTAERLVSDRIGTYTGSPLGNLTIVEDQATLVEDLSVKSEGSGSDCSNVNPGISTEASRDVSNISVEGVKNEPTVAEYSDQVEAVGGSEETFSKPCQPCLENDKHTDSMLYCLECEDYLCERCVEMHRGVKLTKRHTLVPKEMPDQDQFRMIKKETCHIHLHEFIEWFCVSDDKLCCQVCKATEHRRCKTVVAVTSIAETMELQTIEKDIEETKTKLKTAIEKKQVDITNLEEDRKDSLNVLDKIKSDTENTFKRLACSLEDENRKIEAKYKTQNESIKGDIENYFKIVENLDRTVINLQKKKICKEYKFIQMKKAEIDLKAVQKTISEIAPEPVSTPIGYERNRSYDRKLNAFDRFGYFDEEKCLYKCSEPKKVKIIKGDEDETSVWDICVVGLDVILITDWINCAIKLVDTKICAVKSKLNVTNRPFGICKLEGAETYAVTLAFLKKVVFIETSGKTILRSEKTSFDTGEICLGIECCNSRLLLACGGTVSENGGPGHIRIFDMNGKLQKAVISDALGRTVFSGPYKITKIPDKNSALVTDTKCLIEIDSSNNAIRKVDMPVTIHHLASLCFDPECRVLIAESSLKSIKLISRDFCQEESVVTNLPQEPLAVAFDHSSLKIFVGLKNSKDLFCFQMRKNKWGKTPTFR